MAIVEVIKDLCSKKSTTMTELERELGLGKGVIRKWDISSPNSDNIKKVADYFRVSVDFLLGREEIKSVSASNISNSNIVQGNHATTLIVKNGETKERELTDQEIEILRIYNALDIRKQTILLSYAFKLEEEIL